MKPPSKIQVGNYRWTIAALLLFATTINYMDRQVISYLKPFFCSPVVNGGFGWTNTDFSYLTSFFTGIYALVTISAGRIIDKIGTKLGLALSLIIWSIFGIANAFVGATVAMHAFIRSMFAVGEAGNFPASNKTVAEWFPKKERALAFGIFNSGSNIGAMIAALFVPWCLVTFGGSTGWKMSFIITGVVGFIWLIFWFWLYDSPSKSDYIEKAELEYINSDEETETVTENHEEKKSFFSLLSFTGRTSKSNYWGTLLLTTIIGIFLILVMKLMLHKTQSIGLVPKIYIAVVGFFYFLVVVSLQSRRLHDIGKSSKLLFLNLIPVVGFIYLTIFAGLKTGNDEINKYGERQVRGMLGYSQTWAFFAGKFFTDGIWWFYLFWLPDYLIKQFGMTTNEVKWPTFIVYGVAIVGSVFGGSLPLFLINKGLHVYKARMTAMLCFAILPLAVLFTQYFGNPHQFGSSAVIYSVLIICIGAAAHQAWSANLFTTVSDMFPKKAIASITGIGTMAGGIGGVTIQLLAGNLTDFYVSNPQKAYLIMFVICALSYLIAWTVMKLLVPEHKPITDL